MAVVGIKDYVEEDNAFSVYPNPTSGQFTVELLKENAEVIVTDMLGKQISKIQTTQKKMNWQLEDSGFYIVNVKTNQGTITRKLIVNR